jgi:hypothetical protein
MDIDHDLLAGSFDDDLRDSGVIELLLDEGSNLHVLYELFRVVLLSEPIRLPPVKGAYSKTVGMNLLTHA